MSRMQLPIQTGSFEQWIKDCFDEIDRMAAEDIEEVIADFKILPGFTPVRTLGAASSGADAINFLCTLIDDIKRQGQKRKYAG